MKHRRLVADRFRRIWGIVEDIAREPGRSRRQLAQKFALSERQVQADLSVIRVCMRLPLVRRQGYRFTGPPACETPTLTLEDAHLLLGLLRRAAQERLASPEAISCLGSKLTTVFPLYLQPLVRQTLVAVPVSRGPQHDVVAALADALLRGRAVRLHYAASQASNELPEPVVSPEMLLPYLESWYLVGHCRQRGRSMMFDLSGVAAVTVAGEL